MRCALLKHFIFLQKHYVTLQTPLRTEITSFLNYSKVSSKNRIKMKNTFRFKEEFQSHFDNNTLMDGKIISSDLLQNQEKALLKRKKVSPEKNFNPSLGYRGELLFGIHPVYLALLQKKRTFYQLYIRKDTDYSNEVSSFRKKEIINLAKCMNVPISYLGSKEFKMLSPGTVHQGVCLDAGYLPLSSFDEDHYSEWNDVDKLPLRLVLDEILDPMNVGAIIRSAYYFGVKEVFTVKRNSCKLSPTVSKASSGALEVINIYQIDDLEDFIKKQKKGGWYIVSTLAYSENQNISYERPIITSNFALSGPTILILGNEGTGISENVLTLCDSLISIQPGQKLLTGIDSLNVSVATGVILYTLANAKRQFISKCL